MRVPRITIDAAGHRCSTTKLDEDMEWILALALSTMMRQGVFGGLGDPYPMELQPA